MIRQSREGIVTAALAVLDEFGLPDLTMRRLAQTLGLQPGALYWHVPDKQTLLGLVAERIVSFTRPTPEGLDWAEALTAHTHALRDALLAYRDAAEVVASSLALGLGGESALGRMQMIVRQGGFDESTARAAATAIMHFVLGHVWHEQQRTFADGVGVTAHGVGHDPVDAVRLEGSSPTQFDFGIGLLVHGLTASGLVGRPRAAKR